MINWSTDEEEFKKKYPKEHNIWRLTQLINYGLDGERLDTFEVKKSWGEIKNKIDTPARDYLEYLLWGTLPSSMRTRKNS